MTNYIRGEVHAMVDCETLSLSPHAAIMTIGLVFFTDISFLEHVSLRVDVADQLLRGAVADQSTLDWWRQQGPEARAALSPEHQPTLSVALACNAIVGSAEKHSPTWWWANGPQSDLIWLEQMFASVKRKVPWSHRQPQDVRTLLNAAGVKSEERAEPTVKHSALADAGAQVLDVQLALSRLADQAAARVVSHHPV